MAAPPDSYTALLVTNQRHHMNWFASERFHWTNIKVNIFLLNNKRSLHNRHYCINYLHKTGHCEAVCYRSSLITNTLALLFVNIPVNHRIIFFLWAFIYLNSLAFTWDGCNKGIFLWSSPHHGQYGFPHIVVSFGLSFCWWQL